MRNAWLNLIIVPGALALVLAQITGCRQGASPAEASAAEKEVGTQYAVTTVTLSPTSLEERISVTGTLKAANEVEVGPRIGGRITWMIGKEGAPVKRGEVVARLDDTDMRTQVRSAEAALEAARARYAQAKAAAEQQVTATDSGIRTATAELEAAQARLKQAEANAAATDASTAAQVKSAQAALDAARSRMALVENGARAEERAVAANNLRLAKATYENDKSNYEKYRYLYEKKAVAKTQLDNAETKMKVSEAQYASAKEQLAMIEAGARQEDRDAAEAAVRQAEEGLVAARAALKQNDVARANMDIARANVAQAKAMLENAKSARQVNVMRDKDVLAAQSAVTQAKEALTAALQTLDYTQVYAPVDGVVATRMSEVGANIGANKPVLTIATEQSLYFEANVSELEATRLRAGQPVELHVDALQGNRANIYAEAHARVITGTVEKVVPVVNKHTRTFAVRVVVPAADTLFPGMFARGEVIVAKHDRAIAIPKDALVNRGDREVVFVADNGVAHERAVTLGASTGQFVQVLSGLEAGDQVITVGQKTLLDGDRVTVSDSK